MDAIKKLLIAILVFSFAVFIILFGQIPAFRKGPVGWLSRFIRIQCPAFLSWLDIRLTGGRFNYLMQRISRYLLTENHPLILIFFLVLLLGSEVLFMWAAFFKIHIFHRGTALLMSFLPIVFTYRTVRSSASFITAENHCWHMQEYPYDHVLYQPGQLCRTCKFLKPARSKHCNICRACVARHDHHCVWVMNCVGKGNYAQFVALLMSLSFLLTYGAWLAYVILTELLRAHSNHGSQSAIPKRHWSAGITWSKYFESWSWALAQDFRIGGIGLLALLTAPLAWCMFLFHIYLIWAGTTTNESSKWSDWRDSITNGNVYRWVGDIDTLNPRNSEVEPFVDWPVTSKQRLLKNEGAQTPRNLQYSESSSHIANDSSESVRSYWQPVYGLQEIENLYDLGFWENLGDILDMR